MEDGLRFGSARNPSSFGDTLRAHLQQIFDLIQDFVGDQPPWTLVDAGRPELFGSRAQALQEASTTDPIFRLVLQAMLDQEREHGFYGADVAYLALRSSLAGPLRPPALDGLRRAYQQARALLEAQSEEALDRHLPGGLPRSFWTGLRQAPHGALLHLDDIVVEASDVDSMSWSTDLEMPWILKEPLSSQRVLLCMDAPLATLRSTYERRPDAQAWDRDLRQRAEAIQKQGVDVLITHQKLVEETQLALESAGMHVLGSCTHSMGEALERLSGATWTHSRSFRVEELGIVDLIPARKGCTVEGAGHARTLTIPKTTDVLSRDARDRVEAGLRLAKGVLEDPRQVPPEAWTLLDVSLTQIQGLLGDRRSLGVERFQESLRSYLTAWHAKPDFQRMLPRPVPLQAILGMLRRAEALTLQLQRLDGIHLKSASTGQQLRGGGNKIGSPKGMPGDIPPLM